MPGTTDVGGRASEQAAVRDHAGSLCRVASAIGIGQGMTQSRAVKSVPAAVSAVCSVVKPGAIGGGDLREERRFAELRGELRRREPQCTIFCSLQSQKEILVQSD
jgi:hypothetical protein